MTQRFGLESHLFWVPKGGLRLEQMEDAAWPPPQLGTEGWSGRRVFRGTDEVRLAVSDGATESVFAHAWAWALVRASCAGELDELTEAALGGARERWSQAVRRALERMERTAGGVPWYLEEKIERGAFATLLSVRLRPDPEGWSFECTAVGDSCLLWVTEHGDHVHAMYPLKEAQEFAERPLLLSTAPTANGPALSARREPLLERLGPGDSLFLATDAFAAWMYSDIEAGGAPWVQHELTSLDASRRADRERFEQLVQRCRAEQRMRNDDVVFLRVRATSER